MYHALALLFIGLAVKIYHNKWIVRGGWFFIAGVILFSGSLYILSLTGIKWMGAFTPFGGLSFLGGWFCLVMGALKETRK